jgi:hypothetical protein
MALKVQNFKTEFSDSGVSGFNSLTWLHLKMLITISSSKERSDISWHDLAMEIHRISPLGILNQPIISSQELSDYVYDIFENFWWTNLCNRIGWLFLIPLDKVTKEKDEFRNLNSQIECHMNDLKTSICALKVTLIFYNCQAQVAKIKPRISFCHSELQWSWTTSLKEYLLLHKKYWLRASGTI